MKAFLSHSSHDKEFVRKVSKELGRQFCVFDEQVFKTGEEFRKSIEEGLDDSSVFVLFASREALKSVWVEFEIEEAWYQRLRHNLSKSLVYLIDTSVSMDQLPEWLRRALVRRENTPKALARDIRYHLDELLRERQHPYFVGRSADVEALEHALTPIDGSPPPHAIFVMGLPGIGRRSLVRNTVPRILGLHKYVEVRVGEGDSINDICVKVADHVEPYSTREGFDLLVRDILRLSEQEALRRTLRNLRALTNVGELPILLDEGGLLDNEGYIREPVRSIVAGLTPSDEAYLFFISQRYPQPSQDSQVPVVRLQPLPESETRRLISMYANRLGLRISSEYVSELAEYIAGYPPAAYFAVQQAKYYGLDLVMADKSRLVQFTSGVFLRHLAGLNLDTLDQDLLRLTAIHSPLPLPTIATVLEFEIPKLHATLIRLIDLALIITTDDGHYRIAEPIAAAAVSAFGFPTQEQHRAVAIDLNKYVVDHFEVGRPQLELSRVLFRAAQLAGDKEIASHAFHLANDLIILTETHYHSRNYFAAASCARVALQQRPDSITARSFLIRSLIHQEEWENAESQISALKAYAPPRDIHFLAGFLERRQGNVDAAIQEYKTSERLGRKGAAIKRELGQCYFIAGNLEEASQYIHEALKSHGDNPYIVDLWAQVATRQRDEATARQALSRLEVLDTPLYYNHRRSRIELAFGDLLEARNAARLAVENEESSPFEAIAQLAYCEIELGNIDAAEGLLAKLDSRFKNIRRNIRTSLRCRWETKRGRFRDALMLAEQIDDKRSPYYKKIRLHALEGELGAAALSDKDRAAYQSELDRLQQDLASVGAAEFVAPELDVLPRTFPAARPTGADSHL